MISPSLILFLFALGQMIYSLFSSRLPLVLQDI